MHKFFTKYATHFGEKEAINIIVNKAKHIRKHYEKGEDYEECLKELSEMIDDFFKSKLD